MVGFDQGDKDIGYQESYMRRMQVNPKFGVLGKKIWYDYIDHLYDMYLCMCNQTCLQIIHLKYVF